MKVLSIQFLHNATVALLIDGKIVAAVSQEKFDGIKNSADFPAAAIRWVLDAFHLKPSDIDHVAHASHLILGGSLFTPRVRALKRAYDAMEYRLSSLVPWLFRAFNDAVVSLLARRGARMCRERLQALGFDPARVVRVEHHTCHAYAAYYGLRQRGATDPALVLTADGSGDWLCATVSVVEGGRVSRIVATPYPHSLGQLYANVVRFLGMKALEHEHKVMGLAPYAKETYARALAERCLKTILWLREDNPLVFHSRMDTNRALPYLDDVFRRQRFDTIAGAIQLFTEDLLTEWVQRAVRATGIQNVYTGGGLFMNVKANLRIMELPDVDRCHFMPSCGDESNPIGAAYFVYRQETGRDPEPLDDCFLGPWYREDEVRDFLKQNGAYERYRITEHEDIEERIAELLAQHEVVARVAGRAEWGARALGNRSILANPSDAESVRTINAMIKQRDFWMPFAPSILAEDAERYIENPKQVDARYMIVCFRSTPLARVHLRAAMHPADGTLRVQLVHRQRQPGYWALLDAFKRRTGIGGILNTSLNIHGDPIAATLAQALRTFERSGLRWMAIERFLLSKSS